MVIRPGKNILPVEAKCLDSVVSKRFSGHPSSFPYQHISRGVPLSMRRIRPRYLDPDSCDRPAAVDVLVREEPDEEEDDEEDDDEGDDQDDENDDEGYSEKPAFGRGIGPGGQDRALLGRRRDI